MRHPLPIERLSPHLFWDVDPAQVDPEAHAGFLIPRIMDRGTMADVEAAWGAYGPDRVREVLLRARSLNKKTIAFFAAQFGLALSDFRAHQPGRESWDA